MVRPDDWYWAVAGNDANVYSSARNIYVPTDDADYVAWLETNAIGGPIASEAEIWPTVSIGPRPLPAWLFDGTTFAQPALDQYTKTQLKSYSADARWRKEQGGISVTVSGGSMPIKTDDRAQAKINGVRFVATVVGTAGQAQPEPTISQTSWVATDLTIWQLSSADVEAMSDQLQQHINGCFVTHQQNVVAIDAGTLTSPQQIDAAFNALARDYERPKPEDVWKVRKHKS